MTAATEKRAATERVVLNDGTPIPRLGFGTFQIDDDRQAHDAVLTALNTGYRLVDTASAYQNERGVGDAIRDSAIPREELFVTTKLWNSDHGYSRTFEAFQASRERLGLTMVDLYLIHWPGGGRITETWDAMIELREQGAVRSIGVSNFGIDDLRVLKERTTVIPAVNQIEWNVFTYPRELIGYCHDNGIAVEAYSPLARGNTRGDSRLIEIAETYHRTPAQVMLRWLLQHDAIIIPKSANPERIRENCAVYDFVLSPSDMARLDTIAES